jgi:chromosome segregation ATPase
MGEIKAENASLKDEIIALTQEIKSLNETKNRTERALMDVCTSRTKVADELLSIKVEKVTLEGQLELMEESLKSLLRKNGSRYEAARKSWGKKKSKVTKMVTSLRKRKAWVGSLVVAIRDRNPREEKWGITNAIDNGGKSASVRATGKCDFKWGKDTD